MSAYAKTLAQSEQFELYVKKFRSLFDMHHIQFGSPEDFPAFMQKLREDPHFAMDFWALAGTLSRREGGELSVEQMLAVIVDGVAGGDITGADDGLKTLVSELASLLAGVDVYSPSRVSEEEAAPPPSPESPLLRAVSRARSGDAANRAAEEGPVTSSARAAAVTASAVESVLGQSGSSSAPVQHQLDELLARLQMKELELQELIDDLEKKLGRIEPRIAALASKVLPGEGTHPPAEEPLIRPVRKLTENPRLVLEPREEPFADKQNGPPISIPLGSYSQRGGHRGRIFFVVILFLLVVGGVLLQQRYGSWLWQSVGVTVRERYDALLQKMHGADTAHFAVDSASQNATPSTVAESSAAAATTSDAGSVNPPTIPDAPTPSPSTAEPSSASEQTMADQARADSGAPQAVGSGSNPRSSRKPARASFAEAEEIASMDRPLSPGETANAVKVAPAVMEANLLASRVPAYPETAKERHIEGPVVVQALISKDGFVDRVHVIEGNPQLRNAAAEAIQRWRYKPYLLNGHPVEVATTITVEFELDEQ